MSIGYDLFDHDSSGILELQRDDEEAAFESDDDAWLAFINDLTYLQSPDALVKASLLLENWRPHMLAYMRGEELPL